MRELYLRVIDDLKRESIKDQRKKYKGYTCKLFRKYTLGVSAKELGIPASTIYSYERGLSTNQNILFCYLLNSDSNQAHSLLQVLIDLSIYYR